MKFSLSSQLADHITKDVLLTEATPPRFIRAIIVLSLAGLLAFVVWGTNSVLSITTVGLGHVLPYSSVQEVQHTETARISTVHVSEGQEVSAGDLLVTLDDLEQRADFQAASHRQGALLAKVESLRAFLAGKDMNPAGFPAEHAEHWRLQEENLKAMRDEVAQLENQIQLLTEIASIRNDLADQKLGTKTQALEAKSNIVQLRNELLRLKRNAQKELQQSRVDLSDALQTLNKLKAKYQRVQLHAVSAGVVQEIKIKTPGAVVAPGATIMSLMPAGVASRAEIRIQPSEIGFIQVGQSVKLKLATYDYVRYGSASGKVLKVLPGYFTDSKGSIYHKVIVEFAEPHLKNHPTKTILPGMQLQADVVTDQQTVMRYLLRPIYVAFDQGMHER